MKTVVEESKILEIENVVKIYRPLSEEKNGPRGELTWTAVLLDEAAKNYVPSYTDLSAFSTHDANQACYQLHAIMKRAEKRRKELQSFSTGLSDEYAFILFSSNYEFLMEKGFATSMKFLYSELQCLKHSILREVYSAVKNDDVLPIALIKELYTAATKYETPFEDFCSIDPTVSMRKILEYQNLVEEYNVEWARSMMEWRSE